MPEKLIILLNEKYENWEVNRISDEFVEIKIPYTLYGVKDYNYQEYKLNQYKG
jgi:hypothetical protein